MPIISVTAGPRVGTTLHFEETAVLGRGDGADLDLGDRSASRLHARIELDGRRFYLADLGSGNGSFLNGIRVIGRAPLSHRDIVRLGMSRLEFLLEGENPLQASSSAVALVDSELKLERSRSFALSSLEIARQIGGDDQSGEEVTAGGLHQRLELLHDLSAITTETLDLHRVLSRSLEILFNSFSTVDRGFVVRYDAPTGEFTPVVARTRDGEAIEIPASLTLLRAAVTASEVLLCADAKQDQRYAEAVSMHEINLRSVVCVPLVIENRTYGVLQLDSTSAPWAVTDQDLATLASAGASIAHAMANAELHRRLTEREVERHDLELARSIQQRFLPTAPPEIKGWEFAAAYQPAQAVGGDLYSFVDLADGKLGIALGDVSGKGIPAALMMARMMSDLRYLSVRSDDPSAVLSMLNSELAQRGGDGLFMTMLYMVLDLQKGLLTIANAGHMDPIVRRAHGAVADLETSRGPALGLDEFASYPPARAHLDRGDTVLFYSDGLTEAAGHQSGERFGLGRLCRALLASEPSASQLVDSVLGQVAQFAADDRPQDDLTAVAVSRSP